MDYGRQMKKKDWFIILVSQLFIAFVISLWMTRPDIDRPFNVPIELTENLGGEPERGGLEGRDYYEEVNGEYFDDYLIEKGYDPIEYKKQYKHTEYYVDWCVPAVKHLMAIDRLENGSFGIQTKYTDRGECP